MAYLGPPADPGIPGRADILAFATPARSEALGSVDDPGKNLEFKGGIFDLGDEGKFNIVGLDPLAGGDYEHAAMFLSYNMERYYLWWRIFENTIGNDLPTRDMKGNWRGRK